MVLYVNRDAMADVFTSVEIEHDITTRINALTLIETDFFGRLETEQERLCFDMKQRDQSTGQIADELSLSERKVKSLINAYSDRTGVQNPLRRRKASNVIDITHRVSRASVVHQR